MVPVSASALRAGSSLLRKSLTPFKALDLCFWSRSKCSSCAKRDLPSQALPHELVVGSCTGPGTRSSLLRERLTGTIGSPRLGLHHTWYERHDRNCEYNSRSAHGSFSLGLRPTNL